MTYVVPFVGSSTDATIAEAWCATQIDDGYYHLHIEEDHHEFAFRNPFEAQRFRDTCPENTRPLQVR